VSAADFVAEATAELYGSDPEGFTERRAALASQARAAGERGAAKEIAGLRKPTRPAWMINQLVRADPGVADQLAGLGGELRAAAAALDGARIRELSQARRRLVDTLIRQALQQAGEQSPPAALREDLTATFGAALADPQVAREVAAGTLSRAVHRADFSAGMPGLTLVPPPADEGTRPPGKASAAAEAAAARKAGAARAAGRAHAAPGTPAARDVQAGQAGTGKAAPAAQAAKAAMLARAAEQAQAAREAREARAAEERRRAIAGAEQALAEASRAADEAAQAERDGRGQVQALEAQLDEARRWLTGARRRVRETQAARQKAQRALSRLPSAGP
jgi:hypothetical protein